MRYNNLGLHVQSTVHCMGIDKYQQPPTMDKCIESFISTCIIFTYVSMNKFDWINLYTYWDKYMSLQFLKGATKNTVGSRRGLLLRDYRAPTRSIACTLKLTYLRQQPSYPECTTAITESVLLIMLAVFP